MNTEFKTLPQQVVNASIDSNPVGDSTAKNERAEPKSPTKELSWESKDLRILNKEEGADNFYNDQSVTSSSSLKESMLENDYNYVPRF